MKILILEGIATSGKTTVKNNLLKAFVKKGVNFSAVEEDETLMPIRNNQDLVTSIKLLKEVVERVLRESKDFIIFDRLFFTHIFKTKSSIEEFKEIENLVKDKAFLAFLVIDESKIPERIANARNHRGKGWDEYVSKKGNIVEINKYYINQQRLLLNLLEETDLNYKIYNTTTLDLDTISNDILKNLFEAQ
jgi:thymidylate kinase